MLILQKLLRLMLILTALTYDFCLFERTATAELKPLKYHHPGLVVDLGVGLWAWPLPVDFDEDGDLDLVVNCPDKPYNGVYFFENRTGSTKVDPMPVFAPGRRISSGKQNVQISHVSGRPVVISPGLIYPDFLQSGLESPQKLPLDPNVHPNKVRANMWRMVDYDGDGRNDLIIGVGDWTEYGWDNAFNNRGEWTNGPLRGFVYLAINTGTNEKPAYSKAEKILSQSTPVEVYGWPAPNLADFDQDGDLDLLCGEFLDGFTYFENTGSRTTPIYRTGQRVQNSSGQPLTMDLQMIVPVSIDWNQDGWEDLIVGDEDGRVAFVEHTGRFENKVPIFQPPRYFQQEADELKFGALATPWVADLDGDGDQDLLAGNTAGYLGYFENLSGTGRAEPQWGAVRYLTADDQTIRIQAGPNGSIQGPCEAKWGYTTLSIADWDHDDRLDLMVNSIWGKVHWYRNVGDAKTFSFAAAVPVEVEWNGSPPELSYGWLKPEGKQLLTQWRTTPVVFDWNRDGWNDLIMLDHEGFLCWFRRVKTAEDLKLLPPERVFCSEHGTPLQLNAGVAGRSGRVKLCLTDWDGDNKTDLIINSINANLYQQIGQNGSAWQFIDRGLMSERKISGHTTSPTVCDFNGDEIPDLLIGAEDGRFYYELNRRVRQ